MESHSTPEMLRAYVRRTRAREAERGRRFRALSERAGELAGALRRRFGPDVRVYLFGSLLDETGFRLDSDIDLAVEGLSSPEYWEAWAALEALAPDVRFDLVRLESAPESLRAVVRAEGREIS